MSNIDRLRLDAVHASTHAWPGAIEDALDPAPRMLARVPAYACGDRVLVPPTPGAIDPAQRDGGPGEVVGVHEDAVSGEPFAHVALDDSADLPQAYRFDELRREPPV